MAAGWAFGSSARSDALPTPSTEGGFATSDTCRACHPGQYHSWHRSFHRTMTQAASGDAILGDFDDVTLETRGHTTRLERRGEEHWVDVPDPAWFLDPSPEKSETPPRLELPVLMTTGSHHMQYYWIRGPHHGALVTAPWVWLIDDARWVPVQDSFLTPPTEEIESPLMWNASCFACHSVGTRPGLSIEKRAFESSSVELGIACEACHGPAEEHVRANHSPLRRYAQHLAGGDVGDDTIVNPARLDAARSRDVCGQCHSFHDVLNRDTYLQTGVGFRPGEPLPENLRVVRHTTSAAADPDQPQEDLARYFWSDGTIRVAGREYNGMLETGCATRGELTCVTCHSLHEYQEPADQLASDGGDDSTCLGCHPAIGAALTGHTHHAAESEGSRCMNCHMPHTTYGLFKAIRSHRIDSPSANVQAETGRPNACNLCHLDRTLEWTSEKLHAWYGQPKAELAADDRALASSVLWALKGDAVQRGLVAWHMGWEPAQEASGSKWLGAYLAILLDDPYAAVRGVARRSIERMPGFEGFEYDYIAAPAERGRKQREAVARWRRSLGGASDRSGDHLLQDANGQVSDRAELRRLLSQRDHTPIRIDE